MIKVGSTVEYIPGIKKTDYLDTVPSPNTPYTVREIYKNNGMIGIRLDEFKCNASKFNEPDAYMNIVAFREVIFPDDLMAQVEECLTRELVMV